LLLKIFCEWIFLAGITYLLYILGIRGPKVAWSCQYWTLDPQIPSTMPWPSDGSGSKNFNPGQVGSIICGLGWVSHLWFGFEFWKFPLKTSNFSIFFPSGQKKLLWVGSESTQVEAGLASYLLWVKSKLGSGQGPSLPWPLGHGNLKNKIWMPHSLTQFSIDIFAHWTNFICNLWPFALNPKNTDWPDDGIVLWLAESDICWCHHMGISFNWLFLGFCWLCCDWLHGSMTSILLIGCSLCASLWGMVEYHPERVPMSVVFVKVFLISLLFRFEVTLYSCSRYSDSFLFASRIHDPKYWTLLP